MSTFRWSWTITVLCYLNFFDIELFLYSYLVRVWNYEEATLLNSFDNHDYPDKGISKLCLLNELDESMLLVASSNSHFATLYFEKAFMLNIFILTYCSFFSFSFFFFFLVNTNRWWKYPDLEGLFSEKPTETSYCILFNPRSQTWCTECECCGGLAAAIWLSGTPFLSFCATDGLFCISVWYLIILKRTEQSLKPFYKIVSQYFLFLFTQI